jgi:hypothetical protein
MKELGRKLRKIHPGFNNEEKVRIVQLKGQS